MIKKNVEIDRKTPRLVINYKLLNKVLEWIRYPIPNKNDLVHRLSDAVYMHLCVKKEKKHQNLKLGECCIKFFVMCTI